MKNIKDNRKIIIIGSIIVVIILFVVIKINSVTFKLNGEETIYVDYGTEYHDLGVVAKSGFGKDLSDYVTINNSVNVDQPGVYRVIYELDYNGVKYLTRYVYVNNVEANNLEIKLNGDSDVYVVKDSTYKEEGAYVFNKQANKEFNGANIDITGNVDTKVIGIYNVEYSIVFQGNYIKTNRKVHVFDVGTNLSPDTMTSEKVTITLDLSSISNYANTELPDKSKVSSKNVSYTVKENGKYVFTIRTTDGKQYTKIVKIENIVGDYACTGEMTSTGTKLQVVGNTSDITEYEWLIDNTTVKGTNTFSQGKSVQNASVNLVFNNGKKYQVQCSVTDKLVYHFKYDEHNNKPLMRCDTYTAQDKAILDAKLKQVINEAGYGTRAGVVAAARFITGGLDYKIPYEGGQRYNRVGLNIGQRGAWGCSGETRGFDCYHFVDWVRSQNGLELDAYYAGQKYDINTEVNNIKLGDYILTPCTSSECKNPYKINHIALVIGLDSNYIYIAQSTTGNINALVVSKIDKNNLPSKNGNLSLVRHVDYPAEGNVTDMWME